MDIFSALSVAFVNRAVSSKGISETIKIGAQKWGQKISPEIKIKKQRNESIKQNHKLNGLTSCKQTKRSEPEQRQNYDKNDKIFFWGWLAAVLKIEKMDRKVGKKLI